MNDCQLIFELLDEPQQLRQHTRSCTQCADAARLLTGLGQHLQDDRGPSPDFAARVASRVLARAVPQLQPGQRLQAWCRKQMEHFLQPNALSTLLDMKNRKHRLVFSRLAPLAMLYLLPGFLFALAKPDLFQYYLGSCVALLLVGIPLHLVSLDVGILTGLYRGRCLEELSTSGISAPMVVDTLAFHSLKRIAPLALLVSLMLAPSTLFFQSLGVETPGHAKGWLLRVLALWVPIVLLTFVGGSYFYQGVASSQAISARSWRKAVAGLASLGLGLGFGFGLFQGGLYLVISVLCGLGLRELATRRYALLCRGGGQRQGATARGRLMRPGVVNPIYARESARQGFPWLYLAVPCVWAGWIAQSPQLEHLEDSLARFSSQALVLAALTAVGFAFATASAVSQEKQRGTWESLIQTRLSGREFVSGWLSSAYRLLPLWLAPALVLGWGVGFYSYGNTLGLWKIVIGLTLGIALTARAAAGIGLTVALGDHSKSAGNLRLLGTLAGALLSYGLVLYLSQNVTENLLVSRARWSSGWNIFLRAHLPWLCVIVVSAGWLMWSELRLRSRLVTNQLSELVAVSAQRSLWTQPMMLATAPALVCSLALFLRGNSGQTDLTSLFGTLVLLGIPYGFLSAWVLSPLDGWLQSRPHSPLDALGRLAVLTCLLSLPACLLFLLGPYILVLSNSGYWLSPYFLGIQLAPLTALEGSLLVALLVTGYRCWKGGLAPESQSRLAVQRLLAAAALVLGGGWGGAALLKIRFTSIQNPALSSPVTQGARKRTFAMPQFPYVAIHGSARTESRGDYLRSVAAANPPLNQAQMGSIRSAIASINQGLQPTPALNDWPVTGMLVSTAQIHESRGDHEEAVKCYELLLDWIGTYRKRGPASSRMTQALSSLRDFLMANPISREQQASLLARLESLQLSQLELTALTVDLARQPLADPRYGSEIPGLLEFPRLEWAAQDQAQRALTHYQALLLPFTQPGMDWKPNSSEDDGYLWKTENLLNGQVAIRMTRMMLVLEGAWLENGVFPKQLSELCLPPNLVHYAAADQSYTLDLGLPPTPEPEREFLYPVRIVVRR